MAILYTAELEVMHWIQATMTTFQKKGKMKIHLWELIVALNKKYVKIWS